MLYIFSKIVGFFIKPFNLILVFLGLSFIIRSRRWKQRLRWTSLGFFLFFSIPFIYNVFILLWEKPAVLLSDLPAGYDIAVVLGGTTDVDREPNDRLYFHKGAERITHAVNLYKTGKVRKILFTGGNPRLFEDPERNNSPIFDFYVMCGVAPNDIIIESSSRNTHENALFVRRLLKQQGAAGRIILVTSAYHMRRAEACFRKVGLEVTGFSADFYSPIKQDRFRVEQFMPSPMILAYWAMRIKEWIGYIAYWIMGYI